MSGVLEITAKIVGITVESFYKNPVLYKDANCDEMVKKIFEAFSSYGLRPAQISLRRGDLAYDYDVSFVLFGGNGTFKATPEKVEFHLQNATSDKDVEILSDCIAKLYEHVPLPEISSTSLVVNAQTVASSLELLQQYQVRFTNPSKGISGGGTIAYVSCDGWSQEIRVAVDKSVVYSDGLFMSWSTSFSGNKLAREVLKNFKDACQSAALRLDLKFPETETK